MAPFRIVRFLTLILLTKALTEGSFLKELAEEIRAPLLFGKSARPDNGEELPIPRTPSEEVPVLRIPTKDRIYDVPLDKKDSLHLYWQVDYESESVRMEVHSRSESPNPWIAIGFSDRGDFPGSDMCVFWVDWKKRVHFQNAFVDERGRLQSADSEECKSFRYRVRKRILKFTFTRQFDVCHQSHYVIERGTTHIVWAWGEGPLYSLEGVLAKGDYNGEVKLELLKPELPDPDMEGAQELMIAARKVAVPAEETTYWCSVQKLPENFHKKHHMLKFGPKIQKGNEDVVHHMEVFHCEQPPDFQIPLYQGPCHTSSRPKEIDACKRVLAAWAMGATPFIYPNEAGLPIGGEDFNPYVMLEVHYNNPGFIKGRIDSSGLSLIYSPKLRENDAAIMELGLEYTSKMAIPPKMKSFVLAGYCIPECTALGLPEAGIFIFGSQLHTHLTGVRAWTKHLRGDVELKELNRDNHYSTHFQEIRRLPHPVQVLPGDALIMACEYSTLNRENVTVGGFAISDEMCINYVHYYPKIDLEVCKSSVDSKTLMDYFEFMHKLELQPTSPDLDWRENYKTIEWNPLRSNFLQNMYEEAPLSMQCNRGKVVFKSEPTRTIDCIGHTVAAESRQLRLCENAHFQTLTHRGKAVYRNKSNGQRYPGYWENKMIPKVLHPLRKENRKCQRKIESTENGEIIVV